MAPSPRSRLLDLAAKPVPPAAAGLTAAGLVVIVTSLVPQRDVHWLTLAGGILAILLAAAWVILSPAPRPRHARDEDKPQP